MAKSISLQRCTTFGVSCLIHVALIGATIALGRDFVAPRVPAVLIADLTLIETPRLVEKPAPGPAAPTPPKSQKLKLPKPITTPMPAPAIPMPVPKAEPDAAETRTPRPLPADEPSSPARDSAASSAPTTSFEISGDSAVTAEPTDTSRGTSASAPPPSVAAAPSNGITQMAIPRGGYQVRPTYPSSARRLGIQGMTTLRVFVAADGRVGEVVVQESAGHPDLDGAAADAVKRWRFEPARRGTEPVGVWVLLPVQFRLR